MDDDQRPIQPGSEGVHRTHCCDKHGCKYGNTNCPVETGKMKQEGPCIECGVADQGQGGFYEKKDGHLVWHPYITDIITQAAEQLGPDGTGKLTPETLKDLLFAACLILDPFLCHHTNESEY